MTVEKAAHKHPIQIPARAGLIGDTHQDGMPVERDLAPAKLERAIVLIGIEATFDDINPVLLQHFGASRTPFAPSLMLTAPIVEADEAANRKQLTLCALCRISGEEIFNILAGGLLKARTASPASQASGA